MKLASILLFAVAVSPAVAGSIKVCRRPVTDTYTGKEIALPAGMKFVDTGNANNPLSEDNRSVSLTTTAPGTIKAHAKCATVPATAEIGSGFKVGPHDGRRYNSTDGHIPFDNLEAFPAGNFGE